MLWLEDIWSWEHFLHRELDWNLITGVAVTGTACAIAVVVHYLFKWWDR